jgi:hypothetical protein
MFFPPAMNPTCPAYAVPPPLVPPAGEVQVHPEQMELSLSMILKWYGGDFGTKRDLLQFLVKYLPEGERAAARCSWLSGRGVVKGRARCRAACCANMRRVMNALRAPVM